jgi:hypothetical protein
MSPVYDLGKQQSFDNADYDDNDSDIDIDDNDDENNYNYKLNNKNTNSNSNSNHNSNPNSSSNGSSSGTPMKKQKEKKKKKKYNLGIVLGGGRGRGGRSGRGLGLGLGRGFGRGSGKNGNNNNNNSNRSNNHNNNSNNSNQMIRRGNPYPYHNTAHSDGNSNDNDNNNNNTNTKYDEEQAILNKHNSSFDSSDNNDESYVESYIESDASESPSAEEAHIKAIQIQQVKTMTNNIQIQKLQDIQNQEIELINAVSDVIYHNDESVAVSEICPLSDEEDGMGYGYGHGNISGHSHGHSSLGYSIERSNFERGGHHNILMNDSDGDGDRDGDGDASYHHTGTPNKYNRNTAAIATAAAATSASNNAKDEILSDSDISIDEEYALTNNTGPNRSRNRKRNRYRNRSRSNGNGNDYDSDDEYDNVQNRGLLNFIQSDDGSNNTNDRKNDENVFNLQQDIFTLLFISPFTSISFLYAFVIYSFQMSILCLAVVSLLRDTPDGNPWRIPLFITWDVRLAQFLALMVSVFTARDIIQVLDIFQIQYSENIKNIFPKAHLYKWYVSAFLRLAEGVLSLFVAFCFIIQSTDVLDLFLDFAVVQFVGELNDVGFYLAEKGKSNVNSVTLQ